MQNHDHAMGTFADNVGHFFNSHFHSDNSYSAPVTFGDVVQSGLNAYSASQDMSAACGSGE